MTLMLSKRMILVMALNKAVSKKKKKKKNITKISNLAGHNGRQRVQFIHQHEVKKVARAVEESVSLLQGHDGTELRLVIIISQMGNLEKKRKSNVTSTAI